MDFQSLSVEAAIHSFIKLRHIKKEVHTPCLQFTEPANVFTELPTHNKNAALQPLTFHATGLIFKFTTLADLISECCKQTDKSYSRIIGSTRQLVERRFNK